MSETTILYFPALTVFALSEIGPAQRWLAHQHVFVRPKAARIVAFDGYAGLRAYARRHSVFHPVFGDLGSPRLYPSHQNFEACLRRASPRPDRPASS